MLKSNEIYSLYSRLISWTPRPWKGSFNMMAMRSSPKQIAEGCLRYHRGDIVKSRRFVGHLRKIMRKSYSLIALDSMFRNNRKRELALVEDVFVELTKLYAVKFSVENPELIGSEEAV